MTAAWAWLMSDFMHLVLVLDVVIVATIIYVEVRR